MAIDQWLRCVQRDVAWGFFYGIVNFDAVIGTMNHYGNVDMFAGRFNEAYRKAEVDYNENFDHDELLGCFTAMLSDWTNEGYDPFAERDEEWVELFNRGEEAVDLSGWTFEDAVSFTFPEGSSLAPGSFLVVARDAAKGGNVGRGNRGGGRSSGGINGGRRDGARGRPTGYDSSSSFSSSSALSTDHGEATVVAGKASDSFLG